MYSKEFFTPAGQSEKLCMHIWRPEKEPNMILQICHGMSEHLSRYDEFARKLNHAGILVCGIDHPGHGESGGIRGHFADKDGWQYLIACNTACAERQKACSDKKLPYFILGHSMGSFVARYIAAYFPDTADGYIFMSTAGTNKALPAAKICAKLCCSFGARRKANKFIDKLCFGTYAKTVPGHQTEFDWLSADESEVRKYIEDKGCGFPFTSAGYAALFYGLGKVSGRKWAEQLSCDKPYLLLAGDCDPVGNMGRGVEEVYAHMRSVNIKDVSLKMYAGGRHEMLNDKMRDDVAKDVIQWLTEHYSQS